MNYKIFGYTNFNYVELAEYWSHYMQKLDLDYTVYCTDIKSFDHLTKKNKKCVFYDELPQDQFDFTEFGLFRFKILSDLLATYEYVIYSDIDAIWLESPLGDIFKEPYDIHLSTVHNKNAHPKSVRNKWGMTVCTGWMGFNRVARNLIEDFINQYHLFKKGEDQQRFNEFLYSINNDIDKTIRGHSFVLDLHKYQLKTLGLSKNLIHRGGMTEGSKVVHPLTGTSAGDVRKKITRLNNALKSKTNHKH
jgi:hypothetical protein